jgi:hypothetical protein
MSASVSPVWGRAGARLSIFTASTGPSADTGSPVNGEDNRGESVGPGRGGTLRPGRTATSAGWRVFVAGVRNGKFDLDGHGRLP